MSDEIYRKRILLAVSMLVVAAAVGYLLFVRSDAGGGDITEVELPVPEQTVSADPKTTKASGKAGGDLAAVRKAAQQAASRAGVSLGKATEKDGGLEVKLQAKPAQLFAFLAELDEPVGFRRGGQLRASGTGVLVQSLSSEPAGGGLAVTLLLRSP